MLLCEVVHTVFSVILNCDGLGWELTQNRTVFLEFIALKDSVADPEGRSGGCIHTPTLCSKFLSYLWVRFTTCLTPEFLKRQERIVALKWQGKRKGWGRALRWIYPLASYCLFGIRVNLFHCWTASLCFVLILALKRLSTLTNNYLTVPFRLSTTVNDVK